MLTSLRQDVDGKEYLDFIAMFSAVNTGQCNPKIMQAVTDSLQQSTQVLRHLALFKVAGILMLLDSHPFQPCDPYSKLGTPSQKNVQSLRVRQSDCWDVGLRGNRSGRKGRP